MPRKGQNIYRRYDPADMTKAIEAVKDRGLSIRKAADEFSVPKSSLSDYITGKSQFGVKFGRPTVIPEELESQMAGRAMDLASKGFGIGRRQMIARASTICKDLDIKTPFKNGIPGKFWWMGFRSRNPQVVLRKPEKLSTVRSRMLNHVTVGNYMVELYPFVSSMLPTSIWNMDETGISMEHQPTRVIARQGSRSIPGRVGNSRENLTFLPCISAAGEKMPPFIVVRGKTPRCLRSFNVHEGPENAVWKYQAKAWMDDDLGVKWFEEVFLKNCGDARPQLLILDSHHSHETLGLLESASRNNIHVMAMPPHTTHYLCPLDRCVFGPFMREYNRACTEFMSAGPANIINKESVPALIKTAYERAFSRTNIVSGFEATGIYRWNPLAISKEAFKPSAPFDTNPEEQLDSDHHPLQWVIRKVKGPAAEPIPVAPESAANQRVSSASPSQPVSSELVPSASPTPPASAQRVPSASPSPLASAQRVPLASPLPLTPSNLISSTSPVPTEPTAFELLSSCPLLPPAISTSSPSYSFLPIESPMDFSLSPDFEHPSTHSNQHVETSASTIISAQELLPYQKGGMSSTLDPMVSGNVLSDMDAATILAGLVDGGIEVESAAEITEVPSEITWSNRWNEELDSLFGIASPLPKPPSKKGRRLTSHRLLTDPNIMDTKRKQKAEKDEKELQKAAKKQTKKQLRKINL